MTPCIVFDKSLEPGAILHIVARPLLSYDDVAGLLHKRADELHTGDDSVEVLLATIRAFLEVMEVDQRSIERIGRAKRHRACVVFCMRLEDRPGQSAVIFRKQFRIARKITVEVAKERERKQVR